MILQYHRVKSNSTTTRIKTNPRNKVIRCYKKSSQIPLQQGLRHSSTALVEDILLLSSQIPLQQGLRQIIMIFFIFFNLSSQIPLQQGLRQHCTEPPNNSNKVKSNSTTTRIKTGVLCLLLRKENGQVKFHYNKD